MSKILSHYLLYVSMVTNCSDNRIDFKKKQIIVASIIIMSQAQPLGFFKACLFFKKAMLSSADLDTLTGQLERMPCGFRFKQLKTMAKRPGKSSIYLLFYLLEWVDIQINFI